MRHPINDDFMKPSNILKNIEMPTKMNLIRNLSKSNIFNRKLKPTVSVKYEPIDLLNFG